jgi:hypothetical protein
MLTCQSIIFCWHLASRSRDSYPAQTQSDCSGKNPYYGLCLWSGYNARNRIPQHHIPTINYTALPLDLLEYSTITISRYAVPCNLLSTCIHYALLRSFKLLEAGSSTYHTAVFNQNILYTDPLRVSDSTPLQPTSYESAGYFFAQRRRKIIDVTLENYDLVATIT